MTTYLAQKLKAQSNAKHRRSCADLLIRFKAYRAIHPVNIRAVCNLCGIFWHQPINQWHSRTMKSIPSEAVEKIDKYLKDRGF